METFSSALEFHTLSEIEIELEKLRFAMAVSASVLQSIYLLLTNSMSSDRRVLKISRTHSSIGENRCEFFTALKLAVFIAKIARIDYSKEWTENLRSIGYTDP
ncbi:hypothetical protein L6164_021922 [Bauhinia variegata]|uniref:Uncharacterized protein n=1 Tax=Bauhinia variegata TaxID=167791 RepID=A0ACB9MFH2_BAUVA|nr:hypothetical protein L6164_021922 [Bauhinia variegata]